MAWELTGDVDRFVAVAGDFLRSRPVQHTVLLTVVDALRRRGLFTYGPEAPTFGWWRTQAGIDGVLLWTPPHAMMFSAIPPEAVPAAVSELAHRAPHAVNLAGDAARTFAAEWERRTGRATIEGMRTRLYRLNALVTPDPPPSGRARRAGPADRPLLLDWMAAFHEFIGEEPVDVGASVDERLSYGGVWLWEDVGEPVSMAIRSRDQAGMVRVQIVFTPPSRRGRGYAAGATTAATRDALETGARDVVLFTDLSNPISNRLYPRLGYRPVEDRTVVKLS